MAFTGSNFTDMTFMKAENCTGPMCYMEMPPASRITDQLSVTVFLSLYITIFTTGIIANLTILALMLYRRKVKKAIHLYTTSLAVCDTFVLLIYVPTQMVYIKDHLEWKMGLVMCKVANVILPLTVTCTIGTLVAIAFDRVRAVIRPAQWNVDSIRKAKVALPIIWLLSIALNVPLFTFPKLEAEGSICIEGWDNNNDGEVFWICIFTFLYCCPLITLAVAYVFIVRRRMSQSEFSENQPGLRRGGNEKMMRICVSLVVTFAICTGFQHFLFLVSLSTVDIPAGSLILLYLTSNFLISLQAAVNPFIYGKLHKKVSFRRTLDGLCTLVLRRAHSAHINNNNNNNNDNERNIRLSTLGSCPSDHSSQATIDNHVSPSGVADEGYLSLGDIEPSMSLFGGASYGLSSLGKKWVSASPLFLGSNYVLDTARCSSSLSDLALDDRYPYIRHHFHNF